MSGPDPWRRGGGGEEPFEELADGYDSWFDTSAGQMLFDLELGALRPLLAGAPGPGLEVGVGSGRFASALGVDVGVDVAATPLVRAGSRGVSAVRAAGEQLPFAGGVLGAVVLVVTLCFVDDPGGVLAEAGRVLGPDGRLVMGVVPRDGPWGRSYEEMGRAGHRFYRHARFHTLEEDRRLLPRAGFRVVDGRSTLLQAPSDRPHPEPVRLGVVGGAGFVALGAVKASDPDRVSGRDGSLSGHPYRVVPPGGAVGHRWGSVSPSSARRTSVDTASTDAPTQKAVLIPARVATPPNTSASCSAAEGRQPPPAERPQRVAAVAPQPVDAERPASPGGAVARGGYEVGLATTGSWRRW